MMRILVAFDGSATGGRAALFVTRFAAPLGASVVVLGLAPQRHAHARERQLSILRERAAELGLEVSVHVATGEPARRLEEEVSADGYDLVVLGGHGHGGLFSTGAGMAARLTHHLPVPVLIARRTPPELQRILVCTGGRRPHGVRSFGLAAEIAAATGASVEVLHVMSQVPVTREVSVDETGLARTAAWHMDQQTEEGRHLTRCLQLFRDHDVSAKARIRYGLVVDEILDEAVSYLADLVVLGAHEGTGLLSFLLDDITQHVIDGLNQPVLVVRGAAEDDEGPPAGGTGPPAGS